MRLFKSMFLGGSDDNLDTETLQYDDVNSLSSTSTNSTKRDEEELINEVNKTKYNKGDEEVYTTDEEFGDEDEEDEEGNDGSDGDYGSETSVVGDEENDTDENKNYDDDEEKEVEEDDTYENNEEEDEEDDEEEYDEEEYNGGEPKTNKITEQSAVDFIFEELDNKENGFPYFTMVQIYNKAKEMEKQQERSYSEKEVLKVLKDYNEHTLKLQALKLGNSFNVEDWFEQFKKK